MTPFEARRIDNKSLPMIDVSGLMSPDASAREAVGREIRSACTDLGFMYIVGHGVSENLRGAMFEEAARFFALPDERKLAVHMKQSKCNRGYEPIRHQTLQPGAPPDLKEGFYIAEETLKDDPRALAGDFNFGPNQWPDALPGFRDVMMAYHGEMLRLGALLMRGIALSLDMPEDYFTAYCSEPLSRLRLLHYPPQPANAHPDEKGCGAHTDFGGITMLMQDDNGGLQVLSRDGEWIHAQPVKGTYIVNLGDMMARWTNDVYRSTVHRVVNFSGRDRYSIPCFYSGRPTHRIAALSNCLVENEAPKYAPTTVEAHMREMYARTYAKA